MRMLLVVLFLAGCFPYRETYRPEIDGVTVDAQGAPLAAVRVEACTGTHWNDTCRFHVSTTSDDQGRFHLTRQREWTWCCIGEAPLPYVVVAGCAKSGLASAFISDPHAHEDVRLVIAPGPLPPVPLVRPKVGETVHPNDGREEVARAFATRTCTP